MSDDQGPPDPERSISEPESQGSLAEQAAFKSLDIGRLSEMYQRLPPTEVPIPTQHVGFDFSTKRIQRWEVDAIRAALNNDQLEVGDHAIKELRKDGIGLEYDLPEIISHGSAVEKDLPGAIRADGKTVREPGINFEHTLEDGSSVPDIF